MLIRMSLLAVALASSAMAEELAKGDAIHAAIAGNTVQGSMTASGAYAEFYAADGAIKAKDYAGNWKVDGDKMCFDYGEGAATCFGLRLAGDQVTWVGDAGDEGTGTIIAGNPNGF